MATKVIFDNATLADAINKAARIAPVKGAAFDQANGILFVISIASKNASIRATDLECTFMQDIPILECQGSDVEWRIQSPVLAGLVSQLPMQQDSVTEFIDRGDSWIRLKSNKLVAKLAMLKPEDFPNVFNRFSSESMVPAQGLAHKVEQVSWAVDSKSQILCGVHVDGKQLVACNQYLAATIPCEIPVDAPVTVPLSSLTVLLKSGSDIRCNTSGTRFNLMLDNETRASTTVLSGNYPDISKVLRTNFVGKVNVHRQSLIDALNSIMVLIRQERLPKLLVEINGTGLIKMLTVDMEVPEIGRMQNSIDIDTDWNEIFKIYLAPKMFLDALEGSKADQITISFGHADPLKHQYSSIEIADTQGYKCHVMPRKPEE